jgi:hypothetical protein
MKKLFILIVVLAFIALNSHAQIGIKTETPDPSAELDIVSISADKGLLIPRVTISANLNDPSPVTNPAVGLLVFNIGPNQEQGFYYWEADGWHRFIEQSPSGGVFFQSAIQCYNTVSNFTNGTPIPISWQGVDYIDPLAFTQYPDYPTRIYMNVPGIYEISYVIDLLISGSNQNVAIQSLVRTNGVNLSQGKCYQTAKPVSNESTITTLTTAPILHTFTANQYVEILFGHQTGGSGQSLSTIVLECTITVKLIKSF